MDHFKYHPLNDCDDSGMEKVPMFFSLDRDIVADQHSLYLEEIVPRRYRLISRDAQSQALATGYKIHCPSCGTVMDRISINFRCISAPNAEQRPILNIRRKIIWQYVPSLPTRRAATLCIPTTAPIPRSTLREFAAGISLITFPEISRTISRSDTGYIPANPAPSLIS